MPIANSFCGAVTAFRCGQPGAAPRARRRGCSKPRTEPPGCAAAAASGTRTSAPLVHVEHHGDGTSQYTFGEASTVPPDSKPSPSATHAHGGLPKVSPQQPPAAAGNAEQHEAQHSAASGAAASQSGNAVADEKPVEGASVQEDSQAGAASGGGPLAGIPVPRRAYTMLAPREMKDRQEEAESRKEGAQQHTVEPGQIAEDSTVPAGGTPSDTSRGAVAATGAGATPSSSSGSTAGFQKMSHVGRKFCAALEGGNIGAAVAMAHTVQHHGTAADCKVLCGPRFFRAATKAKDTSAILSFLHALPSAVPNAFTYQHAITSCRALQDMPATLSILELMYERGTPPDAHHCSNALAVCKGGGDVEQAFVWFARMTAAGTAPDAHMLASLASACSARIRTLRAQRNSAHSCDINVSGIRRQQLVLADRAVGLLNLLPQTGRQADTALWNSILECVAFSGQLARALQLLDDMTSEGCKPDSRTFVALITACNSEGETPMAQKVYRAALRSRCGTIRVHTAALGICLIRTDSMLSREDSLSLARDIHRDVMDSGVRQDEAYKNKLIAAAGCSGDLEFAFSTLEELRTSGHLAVTADTASAVIRACVACGRPTQALTLYKQFIDEGVVPSVKCANRIMDAFVATGDMHAAVDVLEAAVAAGVVPESGTIAALIGGCQRTRSFELAFQVSQAAVARGIPMDGVIGFLLLKTCYASIRMLWARTHAQIAARRAHADDAADDSPSPANGAPTNGALANNNSNNNGAKGDAGGGSTATSNFNAAVTEAAAAVARVSGTADSANGAVEPGGGGREAWAARMMHALTGRMSVTPCEEGTRSARDWRERAHLVYRDLVVNGVPITPRILERAIACMMLDVSRREKARTPQPQDAAPGLPPPPPPDPACTVIARLDGRFDPRAYKYIDDGAAAGRLPSTAVALGGRAVDMRGLLPATVEAFVLQLFHTLFRHLRGERGGSGSAHGGRAGVAGARASGSLALIVSPFRPGLVNVPSSQPERHAIAEQWEEQAQGWSQSEDDADDHLASPFLTSERVPHLSRILRLQRQHNIDLSAVASSHPLDDAADGQAAPLGSDSRGELVGFAAASALRSLKVPHTVDESNGVLVCDAEDLSLWAHRRHIELLTRLQQRRRRRKEATDVPEFDSHSSDSDSELQHHSPHSMHASASQRDMSGDLNSGSLTPGLSGRGAPGGAMQGRLNTQTSRLRASSLHAQHMMQPRPLPDSAVCIWNDKKHVYPDAPTTSSDGNSVPVQGHPERMEHMHEPRDALDSNGNGAAVPGEDVHASHAHDAEESVVTSSGEW